MDDNNDNLYSKLGVSHKKEDVHKAVEGLEKGLLPGAFNKISPDICSRKDYCSIFHADGAGTKAGLAYMYYKETGDINVFKGIVQDAVVMNIDDILCSGATGPFFISNTIGRNGKLISGDIISILINEYSRFCNFLTSLGFRTIMSGGETADIGDLVKTLVVDANVFTTMKIADVIDTNDISKKDVIIGLASFGKCQYEEKYNSGIGSNGLTLARHGTLSHTYYDKYPECYDDNQEEDMVFFGKHSLKEKIPELNLTIGEALLSPTRTYAPLILDILDKYHDKIHGIIHNTGGGQSKVLNFGKGMKYVKNSLFDLPPIFKIIKESSKTSWEEMYQVFNMGHRMELYCSETIADDIINIAKKYGIYAKIIGFCEQSPNKNKNVLEIHSEFGDYTYT
ncbi:MAG: phosphoribosylformylglycinamidine cyclo-ligase [Promethearchaeota archaeon]|nr:MAG: phosphoribosylformylglycinamidine cyclo-ligase [Candidatus Lokiarchaeota archaeon]